MMETVARVVSLIAVMVPAGAMAAAAGEGDGGAAAAVVAGRVVFRDATRTLSASEIERLRWGHLAVELRKGATVVSARPDENGTFSLAGAPGTYHLEYLRIGALAELLPSHQLKAAAGRLTCVGTLEVTVHNAAWDLGRNTGSTLRVKDDCGELMPALRKVSGASGQLSVAQPRPSAAEAGRRPLSELLAGLRLEWEVGFSGTSAYRASFFYSQEERWWKPMDWALSGSAAWMPASYFDARRSLGDRTAQNGGFAGSVAAGLRWWLSEKQRLAGALGRMSMEAHLTAGYLARDGEGARGGLFGGMLRWGTPAMGVGLRAEWFPSAHERMVGVTVDVSPVAFVGSLL